MFPRAPRSTQLEGDSTEKLANGVVVVPGLGQFSEGLAYRIQMRHARRICRESHVPLRGLWLRGEVRLQPRQPLPMLDLGLGLGQ